MSGIHWSKMSPHSQLQCQGIVPRTLGRTNRMKLPTAGYLTRVWNWFAATTVRFATSHFARISGEPDAFGRRFWFGLAAMAGLTGAVYWGLNTFWQTNWLAAEDGLSEWGTVGSYLAGVPLAAFISVRLWRSGHPRIAFLYGAIAVALLTAVLEEISWGQRVFDWATPAALAEVNFQDETTVHNIPIFDRAANGAFALASLLGLVGIAGRIALHRRGLVTTMDLLLPPVLLAAPLLMILALTGIGEPFRDLMELVGLRPVGGETAEVLSGVCVVVFLLAIIRGTLLSSTGGPANSR